LCDICSELQAQSDRFSIGCLVRDGHPFAGSVIRVWYEPNRSSPFVVHEGVFYRALDDQGVWYEAHANKVQHVSPAAIERVQRDATLRAAAQMRANAERLIKEAEAIEAMFLPR
jgi:hypothetical protein